MQEIDLVGFVDSDHNVPYSTSGYIFKLGGNSISWHSSRQTLVALSSTGAEWDALHLAVMEARYLRQLLAFVGLAPKSPVVLREDNQGAVKWATMELSGQFKRRKFLELRTLFTVEACALGWTVVVGVKSANNLADFFTKILSCTDQVKIGKHLVQSSAKHPLPGVSISEGS